MTTNQKAETVDHVIESALAALPMHKRHSTAQHRKVVRNLRAIAQHVREGNNECDTVLWAGCSWQIYRRLAAAVAAEPDEYERTERMRGA